MSMQSVLGVAGGIIGSFFGYPQLGFVVGSLVGGLLTPKEKTEGPRLDDLKVQVSTYGAGIPVIYGTERAGGNVVWSTDKIETSTTEEVGKGGGAEHKSYRYFVHMRIALCETPRDGSTVNIVQIFQDGKLIWDARSGIPIGSALASEENLFAFFTLYQGHSDQLPDPVEEIYAGGVGSVPAYRGVVCISMKAIECPGGRVPQFSFVLSTSATIQDEITEYAPSIISQDTGGAQISFDHIWEWSTVYNGVDNPLTLNVAYATAGASEPTGQLDLAQGGQTPYAVNGDSGRIIAPYPTTGELLLIDLEDRTSVTIADVGPDGPGTLHGRAAFDDSVGLFVFGNEGSGSDNNPIIVVPDSALTIPVDALPGDGLGAVYAFYGGVVYAVVSDGTHPVLVRRSSDGTANISMPDITGPVLDFGARWSAIHVDSKGVFVYAVAVAGATAKIYKVDTAAQAWVELCANPGATTVNITNTVSCTFWCSDTSAIVGPIPTEVPPVYNFIRFDAVSTEEVKVSDIIAEQCERAGETRYDVSAIPDEDTIHGYKIQNPASARSNIDPLLTAFAIYMVDEDGLVKFKKYEDITSVAAIAYDELGQAEDGSEPDDAMPLSRTQEIDLPRSVSVSYIEETFDYQTATETAVRQVTEANEDLMIELPIATNSNRARTVADMIMFARWRSQNTRSLKVSRKYAWLSPGDGLTVEYPRGTFRLWRIMNMTDTGALIELSVEPGDAELYTQTSVGATGYVRQEVSGLTPQTRMVLLDVPIMRDVDNNPGLYVAAEGYGPGWRGYTLWVGDDDSGLEDRGTVTTSVPIGFAESALGAWTPNTLDGKNSVILDMGDDALSSTTADLLMTSRVNLALIGDDGRWEAIQFMTASSLGSGRYLIYGLLRGLFGTERFRDTHEGGDKFVLVQQAGMLRPNQDAGSLGQSKRYRPVSLGRSFDSAPSTSFVNNGIGLLPYSPWNAIKSKAASNDQTITWERRSRLSTNALRGTVPLGEAVESYTVEFYTSSAFDTLAGTLTSSTKSLTITSAQQTAFGLTPGATLYVHISQVSDVVGAGAPLEATL